MLGLASGGRAKGVELGGELRLGFYEGAAVVAHGLVAGIWVFGDEGDDGGDEDDDEEDGGEDGVVDEEDYAHYACYDALCKSVSCRS